MTGRDDPASLRALAQRCRQAARGASTRAVAQSLKDMAEDYDRRAERVAESERSAQQAPSHNPQG